MAVRNNRKTSHTTGFFGFLKANWYVLLGLIIIVPILYKYVIQQIASIQDAELEAKVQSDWNKAQTYDGELELISEIDIKNNNQLASAFGSQVAKGIAIAFGTYYMSRETLGFEFLSFLDPRTWTENENDAFNLLINNSGAFTEISSIKECYSRVYTKGRDLQADARQFLSSKLYNQINWK